MSQNSMNWKDEVKQRAKDYGAELSSDSAILLSSATEDYMGRHDILYWTCGTVSGRKDDSFYLQ